MKRISKKTKWILLIVVVAVIIIATLFNFGGIVVHKIKRNIALKEGKIDDWEFDNNSISDNNYSLASSNSGSFLSSFSMSSSMMFDSALDVSTESANIGLSTGGAKDVNNFRENIENGYFPISTDITYNGLFYDYSFDTGSKNESDDLFSPSYSTAISKDPISGENEYYMTVGLNSNIKESDFERKKLNLVVVLDISGSMYAGLNEYYYDSENYGRDDNKSKMELANESVNILIDQLNDDDRFGMVLFDDRAYLGKEMSLIGETNVEAIKEHILEIQPNGGTNFEAGYTKATDLYDELLFTDKDEYENRIIVITDAMPNCGTISKSGLLNYIEKNADNGIYTTFIGVGVDFNTEVIEAISDVKGANYYSVNTADEFKERMGEQFEYMVTPLVFDLKLNFESDGYEIEKVYGSDTVDSLSGEIMNVNTLFPSKSNSKGEVKGGVVLLKLKKLNDDDLSNVTLSVEYKDRNNKKHSNSQEITMKNGTEYYENTGIRKAIVLTRYVNVLKNWILYERFETPKCVINDFYGIRDCEFETAEEVYQILGENERTSVRLTVSDEYREIFEQFKNYLQEEIDQIGDETMEQEVDMIEKICEH